MLVDVRDVPSGKGVPHDRQHPVKIGNALAKFAVRQAEGGRVCAWRYGHIVLYASVIELLGDNAHGFITPCALARLLVVQVQRFGVMIVGYQLDLCVRKRVAQRAFGQQFFARSSIRSNSICTAFTRRLASLWSFVASERFSHTCFGLPLSSTRATASSRCAGTFLRASYVPCRFRFSPIPKDIYHTTGLYHRGRMKHLTLLIFQE